MCSNAVKFLCALRMLNVGRFLLESILSVVDRKIGTCFLVS